MKTIPFPQALYDAIKAHALHTAPREACGMIAAESDRPVAVYLARNVAQDPYRTFQVDPVQELRFLQTLPEAGLRLWGIYHSHPTATAHPGRHDIRSARLWPDQLHLIAGMHEGFTLRAWKIDPYVREVKLVLE